MHDVMGIAILVALILVALVVALGLKLGWRSWARGIKGAKRAPKA